MMLTRGAIVVALVSFVAACGGHGGHGGELWRLSAPTNDRVMTIERSGDRLTLFDFVVFQDVARGYVELSAAGDEHLEAAVAEAVAGGAVDESCRLLDGADTVLTLQGPEGVVILRYCERAPPEHAIELDALFWDVFCAIETGEEFPDFDVVVADSEPLDRLELVCETVP